MQRFTKRHKRTNQKSNEKYDWIRASDNLRKLEYAAAKELNASILRLVNEDLNADAGGVWVDYG